MPSGYFFHAAAYKHAPHDNPLPVRIHTTIVGTKNLADLLVITALKVFDVSYRQQNRVGASKAHRRGMCNSRTWKEGKGVEDWQFVTTRFARAGFERLRENFAPLKHARKPTITQPIIHFMIDTRRLR
jgi:hypothetical protein